jgi:hypothetical protein
MIVDPLYVEKHGVKNYDSRFLGVEATHIPKIGICDVENGSKIVLTVKINERHGVEE